LSYLHSSSPPSFASLSRKCFQENETFNAQAIISSERESESERDKLPLSLKHFSMLNLLLLLLESLARSTLWHAFVFPSPSSTSSSLSRSLTISFSHLHVFPRVFYFATHTALRGNRQSDGLTWFGKAAARVHAAMIKRCKNMQSEKLFSLLQHSMAHVECVISAFTCTMRCNEVI
jgi:hypothetical protein